MKGVNGYRQALCGPNQCFADPETGFSSPALSPLGPGELSAPCKIKYRGACLAIRLLTASELLLNPTTRIQSGFIPKAQIVVFIYHPPPRP